MEKVALKDFNIEDEADGPGKPIVKAFPVYVQSNTLKIQFYWAEKGTIISAISVEPNVYSFGVVALEITSGKSNTNYRPKEEFVYLLDWAYVLQERGSLLELVDPNLGFESSKEEAMVMLNVALLCTNVSPTPRPIMSQVVSMIEGRTPIQDLLSDPAFSTIDTRVKAVRNHFWQSQSQTLSMSNTGPYTDSSATIPSAGESGHLLSTDKPYSVGTDGASSLTSIN